MPVGFFYSHILAHIVKFVYSQFFCNIGVIKYLLLFNIMYTLEDYNYHLPSKLIAQLPANPPESCKFLIYDKQNWTIIDTHFDSIQDQIDRNSVIVFNDSKVIKSRLRLEIWEIFYLRSFDEYCFEALVKPWKKMKVWATIRLNKKIFFHIDEVTQDGRRVTCNVPILKILKEYGQMPLPPYITYKKEKESSYQPFFAKENGSVAAPTASLHFTQNLVDTLVDKGVELLYTTLHVGLWTFKSVNTEDIKEYKIHSERVEIAGDMFEKLLEAKSHHKKILAVGTTVTRTLESLPYLYVLLKHNKQDGMIDQFRDNLCKDITLNQALEYVWDINFDWWKISFSSTLYIYPGFEFRVIDELITNFHLPKSSLLMLVAWFMWFENMKKSYDHAIQSKYRFYSFWDAMRIK